MKSILKYILTLTCTLSFMACSMDEMGAPTPDPDNTIEFIARPTSFITTNVTTKAAKEGWESYVYNAYLLLYDGEGARIGTAIELPVSDNAILPYRFTLDAGSFEKAYILANVSETFVNNNSNTLTVLQNAVLDISYISGDDYLAAPSMDGSTPSLPMIGSAEFNNKDGNKVVIELESLFAKVNLTIRMNLISSTGLLNRASFLLNKVYLCDLPQKVLLTYSEEESAWVTQAGTTIVKEPNQTLYEGENSADELLGTVTEYTICCYVPEYNLSAIDSPSNKEQNKPSNFDSSKHPVYIKVEGNLTHDNFNSGNGVPFIYKLYLGEDQIDDFNIKRNKAYNYSMTITGINEARLEQDERITASFSTTNLASAEAANCYIISEIGRYKFPAVKGNSTESIGTVGLNDDGTVVHELITDNTANTITNVKLTDGYITFDVNMDTFSAVKNGNTMLLVKNSSGTVLWSWHLWFDGGFYDSNLSRIDNETYSGTNATMMNRNLGADSQSGVGMYYKWGDKSPYFNGAYQGGITGGTWSTGKSVTDPCPPGYKVPSNSVWLIPDSWKSTTAGKLQTGGSFIYDFREPNVLYPYSGYLLSDGSIKSSETIQKEYIDNETSFTTQGVTNQDRYSQLTLSITLTIQHGYSFSNSEQHLHYGYASVPWSSLTDAITIVKCKKETRTRKISWSGITYGEWQDKGYVTGASLSSADKGQILLKLYAKGGVITETIYEFNDDVNDSCGYQVRCVNTSSQQQ